MTMRDEDFGATLALSEADNGLWSPSMVVPASVCEPPDWQSLYEQAEARAEQERARADAAEARAEELLVAERTARSQAGSLKSILDKSRDKLKAAVEEIKEVRRTAKDALFYRSEAARLEKLLSEAGVDSRKRSPLTSLRMEVVRLRRDLRAAKAAKDTAAVRPPKTAPTRKADKDTIRALRRDVDSLTRENARLGKALERAREGKDELASLRKANARQGKKMEALRARNVELQARIARLQSTRSALSQALFGSKSEKQKKKGTGRKRGQQHGAPGHGRTPRPGLGEKKERRNPPKAARTCSCCGKPYVANGERSTSLVEIEVKAHIRRILRTRWRRGCNCASSPLEVTAPPPVRLFDNTPYGISVWTRFLFEHCACLRPLNRIADWMGDQGLAISPGTLADSIKRFVPLFDPLYAAILAHQNKAALRHADETGWRVQEYRRHGRSSRAWLWISVSADAVYYLIDPSRSAKVAKSLFGDTACTVYVVCDRYSAYRKLARELGGKVILCWCWAHQRRDFVRSVVGHARLSAWSDGWVERIAEIYRLNEERLEHYDPARALQRQMPAFDAAQAALKTAVERLFADAEAELAGLSGRSRKAKPLRRLLKHREGLCVFLDKPFVPMDNNVAERGLRCAVIRRRLSFGSNSEDGAKFTAIMHSVVGTLSMHGIDVLRWLEAWLTACAKNGGKPPDDLSPWLPWTMSEARKRKFTAPG
ncbi:MAG: IS66 family transposase [Acidobacteria bacterium]|nr:IS66 family transposase [Acidobacteriota bacterium]